jgi:poly-D-alanine transfer protein DltD
MDSNKVDEGVQNSTRRINYDADMLLSKRATDLNKKREEANKKTKERVLKTVAKTEEWAALMLSHLSHNAQKHVVDECLRVLGGGDGNEPITATAVVTALSESADKSPAKILCRLIRIKQQGYKAQDQEKEKYDAAKFADLATILNKMREAELNCFYCREPVKVFYEFCRDPKQWTLERIDNEYGHNGDNVELACLQCNVRRRTMYYERYQVTKQCVIRKLDHDA